MSIDNKIIIILALFVAAVMMLDDDATKRWCDTYQICEEQNEK